METKFCRKCNNKKILNDFSLDKKGKLGRNSHCKECKREYDQKNRDKQLKYHKEKRINEIEEFKKYDKKYKSENREKQNIYNKNKWKNDIQHKLRKILRGRFWKSIKNENKKTSVLNLIGCSVEQLKIYLESQFKPEMTWLNHGEIWEIDHILPCVKFNLTKLEEQEKCFHYTNLQPLFKTTEIAQNLGYMNEIGNRDKGDK